MKILARNSETHDNQHLASVALPASEPPLPFEVHPTAIVEEGARLAAGCVIHAFAHISRPCQLDEGVVVHPFAAVGGNPQDLSFDPATPSNVRVGARTVIREHV